jgi:hypothetical protein
VVAADVTAPQFIGDPSISHKAFPARRGARMRFTLSEAAQVTVVVLRRRTHGRYRRVGALMRAASAGAGSIRVPSRLHGHRLRRGRYRATLRAVDGSGNASRAARIRFRVR